MPTKAQFDELINSENCTMEGDGRNGVWFRSIRNGTSVFFPYTGYKYNDESISVGSGGYYWSREINTDGYTSAYGLCVHVYDDTIEARTLYDLRWGGYAVRAVVAK